MRVLLAAFFVFAGTPVAVGLIPDITKHISPILVELGVDVLFLLLIVTALILFNGPHTGLGKSEEAAIQELEEKGLLVSTDFDAVRAFQVEEYNDEGLHYFIELTDQSVLYLTGDYLYDYEAINDDGEYSQPQTFPCTQFTIRRHRKNDFVIDILCSGNLLELESREPPFQREEYRRGRVPEDGAILTNESFDELKMRLRQTR
jgi:hypothetical protein